MRIPALTRGVITPWRKPGDLSPFSALVTMSPPLQSGFCIGIWDALSASSRTHDRLLITEKTQRPPDVALHFAPLYNRVQEPVVQQKLAGLESRRQLLPDRLLDHARPGEADQCAGLGDVQIAQH